MQALSLREQSHSVSPNILFVSAMSSSDNGTDFDSTSDMSSSHDHEDTPVGLSDPQYIAQKRKMLDAVNRLREIG